MVEFLLINARKQDLAVAETRIRQRQEWDLMSQAARLEKALRSVRTQLRLAPAGQ